MRKYQSEEINFVRANAPLYSRKDLLCLFNERFEKITLNQLLGIMKNHKIVSGRTGRLKKGHSLNQVPIGTEKVWNREGRSYIGVKIGEPSIWKHKHIHVYEKAHGPLHDKEIVIFLDGNSLNCELDNLMAIDRRINVIMNKKRLPRNSKEETLASIQLAKLIASISDAQKKLNNTKTKTE